MSRWHVRLAQLRASRTEAPSTQIVQHVQNAPIGPTFEQFEQFGQFERAHVPNSVATPAAELLAPLFAPEPPASGEPPFELPFAARRGRVDERSGRWILHFCCECGRWGSYGYDVSLRTGKMGRWYCREHRPSP